MNICEVQLPDFVKLKPLATPERGGSKTKSLPSLALAFYAMRHVLQGLLLDPENLNSSKSFRLPNGVEQTVSGRQVIVAFGWNDTTFDNKRIMYSKAKLIASKQWKGPVPGGISCTISFIEH